MPSSVIFSLHRPKQELSKNKTVKNPKSKIEKPSVFIGCSRESLSIAEFVKSQFDEELFEVDIWDEGIFGSTDTAQGGHQNIHWLKNFTDIYDFAIFIFVPDDTIKSLTRTHNEVPLQEEGTRHNVVFEFGLFLGRIGPKKTYILFDNDTKNFVDLFFTDLQDSVYEGEENFIRCFNYQGRYTEWRKTEKGVPYDAVSLSEAVNKTKQEILRTTEDVDINFLPSTSLAAGYFKNFLYIIIDFYKKAISDPLPEDILVHCQDNPHLNKTVQLIRQSRKLHIKIVIPEELVFANHQNCKKHFTPDHFTPVSFPGESRPMTGNCLTSQLHNESKTMIFYDMPTTLNSSAQAIDLITIHKDIRELLNEKEKRNFKKMINRLLAENKIKNDDRMEVSFVSWETFITESNI